jgi:DNA mismatch repair protein MutL
MAQIKLLSESTQRKIAAGEVITRPVSVVKELVENALDARSFKIEVEVNRGGKDLIRVTDNGSGMDRDDTVRCIERHATSKLAGIDDLRKLQTLGFRGEALASIASVAKLRIETNTDSSAPATLIDAEAGNVTEVRETSRPPGTTVTAQALFYNLPVRRTFLKSDAYELRLIVELVKGYAFAFPEIYFSVTADNKPALLFPPVRTYKDRLVDYLDKEEFDALIEHKIDNPTLSLNGLLSNPLFARSHYSFQLVYFNRRLVRYRLVTKAVYDAYGPTLKGNNPSFIFFFQADPAQLDINIHPTKQEIKFIDERFLYDFTVQAVRQALNLQPGGMDAAAIEIPAGSIPVAAERATQQSLFMTPMTAGFTTDAKRTTQTFWQLHNTYIFAQVQTGYVIVDQHIAHERILYEELLKQQDHTQTQPLLFPIPIELSPAEFAVFDETKEVLSSLGIETKVFSGRTVVVEAVPADSQLDRSDLVELFKELSRLEKKGWEYREEIAKVVACKSAIKAGQPLTQEEIESLINRLFACQNPYFCPHGRPIVIKISLEDLEKRFGRI